MPMLSTMTVVMESAVRTGLMNDISAIAHDKSSNSYSIGVMSRLDVIRAFYEAFARKADAERLSAQSKKLTVARASQFPSISAASAKALKTFVEINRILLAKTIDETKQQPVYQQQQHQQAPPLSVLFSVR
jgi:hypothetical protein